MIKRNTLIPLAVLLVVCFVASGVLKNYNKGILGVLSLASWLGFLVLVVFFIVVAAITIVRKLRGAGESEL